MKSLSRRGFIKTSLTAGGGLMLQFSLPVMAARTPFGNEPMPTDAVELGAWLVIGPDESITFRVAQSEMGQGVLTSMAMLLAEELEADWRKVKVEYASVNRQIQSRGIYRRMKTADSSAVSHSREYLQQAGAEARMRLIKAAAESWSVSVADCYADYGRVYRSGSSDSKSYGELAAAASELRVAGVTIKSPEAFNILGLPTNSLDAATKVDGTAIYSMDVRVPNMVYAAVLHCPVPGGRVRSLRFNAIRHMPGVIKAVRMETSVAVVADTFWQAKSAADKLPVFWDEGEAIRTYSDTIKKSFFEEFAAGGETLMAKGDIVELMDTSEKTIESDYYLPYLSQAPLEPLNCTVSVTPDRVDVWVGHQDPEAAALVVAETAGVNPEQVYLHNCYMGGSFGRRSHTGFVEQATRISLDIGRPVQMIYTREQEMRAGSYRPMAALRFKAAFDIEKNLMAMTNHSVTHSVRFDSGETGSGADPASIEGLVDHPYQLPAYRFSHTMKNTHLTTWHWRSGGHSINAFAMECFVDEMAAAAEVDPLRYRRLLLGNNQRYLDVLDLLEQESGWGKKRLRRGSAMGMAIHESYGTICGQVAEVTVDENGFVTVDRVTAVVDCGNLVNPTGAEKQVEGGIIFGLSAALYGKLSIDKGKVLEDNLDTYEVLGMADSPPIDIHWSLSGGDHWGGLGEPATPVIAPAVCNALSKITKRRIRTLPIRDYYLRVG